MSSECKERTQPAMVKHRPPPSGRKSPRKKRGMELLCAIARPPQRILEHQGTDQLQDCLAEVHSSDEPWTRQSAATIQRLERPCSVPRERNRGWTIPGGDQVNPSASLKPDGSLSVVSFQWFTVHVIVRFQRIEQGPEPILSLSSQQF